MASYTGTLAYDTTGGEQTLKEMTFTTRTAFLAGFGASSYPTSGTYNFEFRGMDLKFIREENDLADAA